MFPTDTITTPFDVHPTYNPQSRDLLCRRASARRVSFLYNPFTVVNGTDVDETKFCHTLGKSRLGRHYTEADPGEGHFLDQILETAHPPPLISGSGWLPHPPYLKAWIRHCYIVLTNREWAHSLLVLTEQSWGGVPTDDLPAFYSLLLPPLHNQYLTFPFWLRFFLAWTWFQSGINTDGAHNSVTTRRLQKGDILSLNCFPMIAGWV